MSSIATVKHERVLRILLVFLGVPSVLIGPKLDWAGPAVPAALARQFPRPLRIARVVTPDTLLRGRRRLVRRRWTCPRQGGRPPAGARVAALIEPMAREISGSRANCPASGTGPGRPR